MRSSYLKCSTGQSVAMFVVFNLLCEYICNVTTITAPRSKIVTKSVNNIPIRFGKAQISNKFQQNWVKHGVIQRKAKCVGLRSPPRQWLSNQHHQGCSSTTRRWVLCRCFEIQRNWLCWDSSSLNWKVNSCIVKTLRPVKSSKSRPTPFVWP